MKMKRIIACGILGRNTYAEPLATPHPTDLGRDIVSEHTKLHERECNSRHRGDANLRACLPDLDYLSYRARVRETVRRGLA